MVGRFNWTKHKFLGIAGIAGMSAGACGGADQGPPPQTPDTAGAPETGKRIQFEYTTLDDKTLSTASLAGRFSVLGFITTYDPASQLQARYINRLLHNHKPRINAALLVLEAPENRPMADAFAAVLKLDCPIAMADQALLLGKGPFERLHSVPSIIILDRQGREVFRYHGVLNEEGLDSALKTLEKPASPNSGTAP